MSEKKCLACDKPLIRRDNESASAFEKRKNCNRECAAKSRGVQRGNATRYESRFGGGWLSAGQYLAENMCDRIARKDGVELPNQFWSGGDWKKTFLLQLKFANDVLKKYSVTAIIAALRTHKGKTIYSLGAKWFYPNIETEQKAIDRKEAKFLQGEEQEEPSGKKEQPRQTFSHKQSVKSKLQELD